VLARFDGIVVRYKHTGTVVLHVVKEERSRCFFRRGQEVSLSHFFIQASSRILQDKRKPQHRSTSSKLSLVDATCAFEVRILTETSKGIGGSC
jgi:hypothetical protein